MPWAGASRGPQAIVKTFADVRRYWDTEALEVSDGDCGLPPKLATVPWKGLTYKPLCCRVRL
jgi:hypothetical protein